MCILCDIMHSSTHVDCSCSLHWCYDMYYALLLLCTLLSHYTVRCHALTIACTLLYTQCCVHFTINLHTKQRKRRPVHWDKMESTTITNTVFSKLKPANVNLDFSLLEAAFAEEPKVAKPATTATGTTAGGSAAQVSFVCYYCILSML
jgi:hypothetical protein